MATSRETYPYDPLAGSRWLQSLTPLGAEPDGVGEQDRRPQIHNFSTATPALAARAYERVLNRRALDSFAREQIPVATPIKDPMPPQTTPPKPPEQETPPAPTQAAPTLPAPASTPAPTVPEDGRNAGDDDLHRPAQQHEPPVSPPQNPAPEPAQSPAEPAPQSSAADPEPTPTEPDRDPLLEANGPSADALPMPSTAGREVGKLWIEERPDGITVEYTIPEGNGDNTVDAVVKDAQGNVVSTARIVRVDATGEYVRWQDDIGGGASYYESGGSNDVGYGQSFAPGASTSGRPTSEFETSPDLTRVRTLTYDDRGRLTGVDLGTRNSAGLYDNIHSDQYNNQTYSETGFSPSGGIESTFTGQIDASGNGWITDKNDDRWDVYPDDNGYSVQRRLSPDSKGYEFKYSLGSHYIHELRDSRGRVLRLTEFDIAGEVVKDQRRVGDQLATGTPDADGHVEYRFTDRSLVGSTSLVMPWEDRPGPRTGHMVFTPDGQRISYDDGEVIEFGLDGGLTSYRPPADTRALWKQAVTFGGRYYSGLGTAAVGLVVGVGALTGFNNHINVGLEFAGSDFRLPNTLDAVKAVGGAVWEVGTTAFDAYKTLAVEGFGVGFGDRSWSEAWRNTRRATGANWNATSKFFLGTDWEGASGRLPETLGQAVFGTAMLFVPFKGIGSSGKGGKLGFGGGGSSPGAAARGRSVSPTEFRGSTGRGAAATARLSDLNSRAMDYGRSLSGGLREWLNRPVNSLEGVSNAWVELNARFGPVAAPVGVPIAVAGERPIVSMAGFPNRLPRRYDSGGLSAQTRFANAVGRPYQRALNAAKASKSLQQVRNMRDTSKRWMAAEEQRRETYGAGSERPYPVSKNNDPDFPIEKDTTRKVDVPVDVGKGEVIAIEIKTYQRYRRVEVAPGKWATVEQVVPLSSEIKLQIAKDVALRRSVPGYNPRWEFLWAGPSEQLAAELARAGIPYVWYM